MMQGLAPVRFVLQMVAAIVVVTGSFINILEFSGFASRFPPRETDPMVAWETRYTKLHHQLIRERYRAGKIGFITARSLQHLALTEQDDQDWAALRYTIIPLLLIKDDFDAPYIIADFTHETGPPAAIEGFTRIEDSGDGLILYKRNVGP
jgi:hypothetical protein